MLVKVRDEDSGIRILSLNRPEKRNAMSIQLLTELCEQAIQAEKDKIRVIILNGEGPMFSAGLDLEEALNKETCEQLPQMVRNGILTLFRSPCITIAACHGGAIAGGAGLVAACDLAVAAESTKIGFPETRRGLVAALIMPFLNHSMGGRHVNELLYLGNLITAQRGFEMGLFNQVTADGQELEAALSMAREIVLGAPQATVNTKRLYQELTSKSLEAELDAALSSHISARHSNEANEGMTAFFEKREPNWKG